MSNDSWIYLYQHIHRQRSDFVKAFNLIPDADRKSSFLRGMILECDLILKIMKKIDDNSFEENSIANIDNQKV